MSEDCSASSSIIHTKLTGDSSSITVHQKQEQESTTRESLQNTRSPTIRTLLIQPLKKSFIELTNQRAITTGVNSRLDLMATSTSVSAMAAEQVPNMGLSGMARTSIRRLGRLRGRISTG